jgi:AbrB family looped-hinge helix DNA binding protein
MPKSTVTGDGQTTIPEEIREALKLGPGDELTWELRDGKVAVTTGRPAFWRWEGFIKVGPGDVVDDIEEARKTRGRI